MAATTSSRRPPVNSVAASLGITNATQLAKFLTECPTLAAAVGSGFIHCFEKDGKAQIALRDRTNKDETTRAIER